jgi:hypothetical protein
VKREGGKAAAAPATVSVRFGEAKAGTFTGSHWIADDGIDMPVQHREG